jgi:hypothetical protein
MSTGRQEKAAALEEVCGENDFVDAKDNQGDWRVGFIVGRYEHTKVFKVRFDGWPSKYDEVPLLPPRTTSSTVSNSNPSVLPLSGTPDSSKTPASAIGSSCRSLTRRYSLLHAEKEGDLVILRAAGGSIAACDKPAGAGTQLLLR